MSVPDRSNASSRVPDILKGRVTNVDAEYAAKMAEIKNRVETIKTNAREEASMSRAKKRQQRSDTHGDVKGYNY
jgi:hypothetical protein